jgi:hypothetical protein
MPEWRIYYGDGSLVRGHSRDEWVAAPSDDVQVVAFMKTPTAWRWTGVTDRELWTGDDVYDPFEWGEKRGAWMSRDQYFAIWDRACGDT